MNINWNCLKEKLAAAAETIVTSKFVGAISTSMPRTFLLGNGDIALISSGEGNTKEYLISKGDFWSCGNCCTDDPMNINPNKATHITYGGISFAGLEGNDFTETLDISSGKLFTKKGGITFDALCNQTSNAIIIKINSQKDTALDVKLWAKCNIPEYPVSVFKKHGKLFVTRTTANFAPENPKSWTSVVASSLICDGELEYVGDGEGYVKYSIKLNANEDVYVIVAIGGGGKTLDNNGIYSTPSPEDEIGNIFKIFGDSDSIKANILASEQWWTEYWMRSFVDLSDTVLEKYYYGSMYLMACFARKGKRPSGLYGNFVTTDNPKWQNDFHLNYNYIAPYYGAYASNRYDFAENLAVPLAEFIPEGKKRALEDLSKVSKGYINGGKAGKYYFNGRTDLQNGIENAVLFPVGIAPYGIFACNERGGYWTQMYDAAFTSSCITAYYSFTLDGKYLQKYEELLRLIVNFYIGWREKQNNKDGTYQYNIWNGAHEGTFEMNTPGALSAIKSILQCLLMGVSRGDISATAKDVNDWTDFLAHIAPYPIRKFISRKLFRKTFDKPIVLMGEKGLEISIGQSIPLEFIHPTYDMDFFTDEAIVSASRNLVSLNKLKNPQVYEQCNAFPKNFTHAIMCLTPADEVISDFKKVLKKQFCYNYSVNDGNVHGIEKCGATEFIHSMLIMSNGDTVQVFPNTAIGKKLQFINLRARGAFIVSAMLKEDGKVDYVEIISEKLPNIQLVNPFTTPCIIAEHGERIAYEIKKVKGLSILSFPSICNMTYRIMESAN